MKILMISYHQSEKEGRFSRAYNELAKKHDVYILDSNDEGEIFSEKRISYYSGKKGISRFFDYTAFVLKHYKKFDFDLIFACNYYTAKAVLRIKKATGKPVVYDAYELYYPAAKKSFSKRDWFFYHFEKRLIKCSQSVIAAGHERALLMTGHYNLKNVPYAVRNMPYLCPERPEIKTIGENDTVKIVYAGYFGPERRIDKLITAIANSDLKNRVKLDLYGYGPFDFSGYKYGFLSVKGPYNNADMHSILKDYHIGFASYPRTDLNNIYCCPNKIYDYVSSGLAIVALPNEGLQSFVEGYKLGKCDDDLSSAICDVISNYSEYTHSLNLFLDNNKYAENSIELNSAVENAIYGFRTR